MEFQIETEKLAKGLYRAQGIVERKMVMPALSNVLIEADEKGTIKITATDLEVGMTSTLLGEVKKPGSLAVNARVFYEVIRNLKKQKVSVKKLENHGAEIKCGTSQYKLLGMPVEEFQRPPQAQAEDALEVDIKLLNEMIDKTLYAASTDEARYNLNGCLVERVDDENIRMVATDGHRLCMIDRPLMKKGKAAQLGEGIIIPRKGMMEIKRLFDEQQGKCRLYLKENSLFIENDDTCLVMRLINGRFPDYKQVVPKEQKIKIHIDRKQFLDSLRRVSIMTVDKKVGVILQIAKGNLTLLSNNPDIGEAREEMEIEYKGSGLTISFNSKYLEDALSAVSDEKVSFFIEDDLSPCVIKPKEDGNYTCVLMPMRL